MFAKVIRIGGMSVDSDKLKEVSHWPVPVNGYIWFSEKIACYYARKFNEGRSDDTADFYGVISKNGQPLLVH